MHCLFPCCDILYIDILPLPFYQIIDEMQEKRVYPNQNVFVALLNVLSRRGHVAIIKEVTDCAFAISQASNHAHSFVQICLSISFMNYPLFVMFNCQICN